MRFEVLTVVTVTEHTDVAGMPSSTIFKPENGDVRFLLNISVFYSSLHGVIIVFILFHISSHRYI